MSNNSLTILASTKLPTQFGVFDFTVFRIDNDPREHIFLTMGDVKNSDTPVLTRIHSECATGESFMSLKCDCREQLLQSMQMIQEEGRGLLIYLNQEGRGIGLVNKIKAYHLQEQGLDTVEANEQLGLPVDNRNFLAAIAVFDYFSIQNIRLLTNNPDKIKVLQDTGHIQVTRVPLQITPNAINKGYLLTKQKKMGHLLDLKED